MRQVCMCTRHEAKKFADQPHKNVQLLRTKFDQISHLELKKDLIEPCCTCAILP